MKKIEPLRGESYYVDGKDMFHYEVENEKIVRKINEIIEALSTLEEK